MKRLIYIADPMCSWCYGFIPELDQLVAHFHEQLDFSIIMGGLRPGGGDPWNDKMKDFLRKHWIEVGERTKQPFSLDLLNLEVFNYDTEPSCRAVVVVRGIAPEKTYLFFKKVQQDFYYYNSDPNELAFYIPICESMDIPLNEFEEKFLSEEYKKLTRNDFAKSRELGISGFPTVILGQGEEVKLVTHGYADYENMKGRIEALMV